MHSTMGQERMTGLAYVHVKCGKELNLDDVNCFSIQNNIHSKDSIATNS